MGLQSGVTFLEKWGYKSRFLGGTIRGGEDTTFSKIGVFLVSIPSPLNATRFLNFTLLNSAISGSLLCFGDVNGGGRDKTGENEGVEGIRLDGLGGTIRRGGRVR